MYNGMNWYGFNNPIFREKRTVLFANGQRFVLNKPVIFYNLLLRDIAIETRLTTGKKQTEVRLRCEFSPEKPLDDNVQNYTPVIYLGTFTFEDNLSTKEINVVDDCLNTCYVRGTDFFSFLGISILGRNIITKEDSENFKLFFRTKLLETLKEAIRSHKLMLSDSILNFFGIEVSQEDIVMAVFSKPEVKITEMEEVTELSKEEEALKYSQDYNNYELLKATGLIDPNLSFEEFSSKIAKTLEEVKRDEAFDIGLYNLLICYKNTLNSYGSDTPREQVISDFRKLVQQVDLDKLLEE